MFLDRLDPHEQSAFLGLAAHLVHSDGVLADGERTLLAAIRASVGPGVTPQSGSVQTLAEAFRSHGSQRAVLLELMGLGYVDGDFDWREQAVVRDVADAMGVSPDELRLLENWTLRQVALLQEAEALMTGGAA
jgi:hypothetical protein